MLNLLKDAKIGVVQTGQQVTKKISIALATSAHAVPCYGQTHTQGRQLSIVCLGVHCLSALLFALVCTDSVWARVRVKVSGTALPPSKFTLMPCLLMLWSSSCGWYRHLQTTLRARSWASFRHWKKSWWLCLVSWICALHLQNFEMVQALARQCQHDVHHELFKSNLSLRRVKLPKVLSTSSPSKVSKSMHSQPPFCWIEHMVLNRFSIWYWTDFLREYLMKM